MTPPQAGLARRAFTVIALLGLGALCPESRPAAAPQEPAKARGPGAKQYDDQIYPFLVQHCQGCHAGEKPKGNFRLDRLAADFDDRASRERWQAVLKKVRAGEMPPKSKPRP